MTSDKISNSFGVASLIQQILLREENPSAIIGGHALRYYQPYRTTNDIDIGVCNGDFHMQTFIYIRSLREEGFSVETKHGESGDPLGGVIKIQRDDIFPIEIINLFTMNHKAPNPGRFAVQDTILYETPEHDKLFICNLEALIALKLAAHGPQDLQDISALLEKNEVDHERLMTILKASRLIDRWEASFEPADA